MKNALWLVLILLLFSTFGALPSVPAQEHTDRGKPPPGKDRQTVELEKVTIIASPIIEGNETDSFAGQKTIVSEAQMEDLNALDLGTALRRTPGVNISRFNPVGSFGGSEGGAVFIRGMGSSRPGAEIKTLVDGIPMYMSVWNHPLLDLMSIDSARSIEVLKSPQPQHFGNAFAVVNLVPRRHATEDFETRASVAVGSYRTFTSTAAHGGKIGAFDYSIGCGYRRSDGHRTDAAGRMTSGYGHFGYALAEHWELRFFTLWSDNFAGDPGKEGAPPAERQGKYETRAWLATLTLSHEHEAASGSVKLYRNAGEGDWLGQPTTSMPGVTEDLFNDFEFHGVKVRETLRLWEGGEIVAGLDRDHTEGDWVKRFSDGRKDRWPGHQFVLTSPYLAVSHRLEGKDGFHITPSAGIRYYDNSDFPSEWSPHAGLIVGYRDTEIHAGFARGVVYPGLDVVVFSETVIPGLGESWKDLRAERVNHFEVGVRHRFQDVVEADITFFYDDGRDRYVFIPPPPPPPVYDNIETFTHRGVEASVNAFPHPDVALFAGATFLDPDPSDLPYAPDWTLSAGVNWSFLKRFKLSMDGEYVSRMFVNSQARRQGAENTEKVGSHFLLNSRLSYRLPVEAWDVEAEVFVAGENLTDTEYEFQPGYPMPGINGMIGTEIRF